MPWGEWDQLKAEAAEKQSMQLNQLPADPGGGGGSPSGVRGDLVVNQDDLGAVGNEAFTLHANLGKQADIAGAGMNKDGAGTTMQAAVSLKSHNFALGQALETTVETWSAQLKTLLQACAHISNHLDYTKASHARDEEQIRASLRTADGSAVPVSRINEYFK